MQGMLGTQSKQTNIHAGNGVNMTIKKPSYLFFVLLVGCSVSPNPVETLVENKSPEEIFAIFGASLFASCRYGNNNAGKCVSEITDGVAAARKNGYTDVAVTDFTPIVKAKFLAKIGASLSAGKTRNAKQTNNYSRW